LTVDGTVAGYPIREELHAWLSVGSPSTQASSHAVPTAERVAWLWDQVPATRRAELQDLLAFLQTLNDGDQLVPLPER
jgi:hypothetical protein